jgi:hypothetical protein
VGYLHTQPRSRFLAIEKSFFRLIFVRWAAFVQLFLRHDITQKAGFFPFSLLLSVSLGK